MPDMYFLTGEDDSAMSGYTKRYTGKLYHSHIPSIGVDEPLFSART